MYAHQIIEDLTKHYKTIPSQIYKESIKFVLDNIPKSQKFHFENGDDIFEISKAASIPRLFLDRAEFCKLPYSICWFDWYQNGICTHELIPINKRAIIVFDLGNDLMQTYSFSYYLNEWLLDPISFVVSIGKTYKQRSVYVQGRLWDNDANIFRIPIISIPPDGFSMGKFMDKITPEFANDLTFLQGTLMLLNCKNIVTESHTPEIPLNKARRKRGKQELFTYKTLRVKLPPNKRKEGFDNSLDNHNRVHLCRGHFKEYTVDAPLFGKIIGLWWWQPQVRGQNRKGIILKDYKIGIETRNRLHTA